MGTRDTEHLDEGWDADENPARLSDELDDGWGEEPEVVAKAPVPPVSPPPASMAVVAPVAPVVISSPAPVVVPKPAAPLPAPRPSAQVRSSQDVDEVPSKEGRALTPEQRAARVADLAARAEARRERARAEAQAEKERKKARAMASAAKRKPKQKAKSRPTDAPKERSSREVRRDEERPVVTRTVGQAPPAPTRDEGTWNRSLKVVGALVAVLVVLGSVTFWLRGR